MLNIIRKLLQQLIDDIDSGNSNITKEEGREIINLLANIHDPYISKYQACQMLNISRATFDNMVRKGILPKGTKRIGFKELVWKKQDLKNYIDIAKEDVDNK